MLQKFDTEANWTSVNPVLYIGEIAVSHDLNPILFKMGNGVDLWTDLPYYGADVRYSNSTPTPDPVGGIPAGSTFHNLTMQQMWDDLLYPYQYPYFTAFDISGVSSPREVGDKIAAGVHTFNWTIANDINVEPDTIHLTGPGIGSITGLPNTGFADVSFTDVIVDEAGSRTWEISADNTQAQQFTGTFTRRWYWRIFWGTSALPMLDETAIEALSNNELKSTYKGTYHFDLAPGEYKYIAYPSTMSLATEFKDVATNLTFPFDYLGTVSITNSFGITQDYRLYRSTYQAGGELNLLVN